MKPRGTSPLKPYQAFSQVYDSLMDDIPYAAWTNGALRLYDLFCTPRSASVGGSRALDCLDLACGTGQATVLLASAGHRVTGMDLSEEMLTVATSRALGAAGLSRRARPFFFKGDMRELSLPSKFDLVTCFCDGLNHLSSLDDLGTVLRAVRVCLRPGGVLVFDLNTPYKLEEVLGDNTFAGEFEQGMYIMENSVNIGRRSVSIRLTFFVEDKNGLYRRGDEEHTEIWFSHDEVLSALTAASLSPCGCWAGYDAEPVGEGAERVVYAAVAL